jgi:hypothetical protein
VNNALRVSLIACVAACVAAGCGGAKRADRPSAAASTPAPAAAAPHIDPHRAGVEYARCMRAHGVPHPDPDAEGDFHLTPAQERRMHEASPQQHEAADAACFHYLKGTVSTAPLSKAAQRAALVPLGDVRRCMHARGYELGKPTVRNMSRGRAMFGFETAPLHPSKQLNAAEHACERKAGLARKLDAIIKADRGENR